ILAQRIKKRLNRREVLSSETLFELAAEVYEGTLAEGTFSARDTYDVGELGFHLYALERAFNVREGLEEAQHTIREIEALWSLLPTQTRRTREQLAFQQFSTPAPYAFACAWAAGLRAGDVVLEPS